MTRHAVPVIGLTEAGCIAVLIVLADGVSFGVGDLLAGRRLALQGEHCLHLDTADAITLALVTAGMMGGEDGSVFLFADG
ncbi:hypothetical protein [Limnoglobus roseus]|uniref:Uncharacterized protein n=1 Tax=Limnoglobus roseus TaxID=2598579 RepID=A0A5C1AF82_9BACT|nr:hypothetical protein [Limnoglobus roseus]QEL17460.1 hypothetical protein PX52LOC_04449 [Limnoglobus roseus]